MQIACARRPPGPGAGAGAGAPCWWMVNASAGGRRPPVMEAGQVVWYLIPHRRPHAWPCQVIRAAEATAGWWLQALDTLGYGSPACVPEADCVEFAKGFVQHHASLPGSNFAGAVGRAVRLLGEQLAAASGGGSNSGDEAQPCDHPLWILNPPGHEGAPLLVMPASSRAVASSCHGPHGVVRVRVVHPTGDDAGKPPSQCAAAESESGVPVLRSWLTDAPMCHPRRPFERSQKVLYSPRGWDLGPASSAAHGSATAAAAVPAVPAAATAAAAIHHSSASARRRAHIGGDPIRHGRHAGPGVARSGHAERRHQVA